MKDMLTLENDWQTILKMFPSNWLELAKTTKAIVRKFRNFKNEEGVMRALLLHVAGGYSLRETATRLKLANIADVSDVALLKRLQCSERWFKELCLSLLRERGVVEVLSDTDITMRLVDGTNVKEPGKTGSLWRIHYSLKLSNLECDYFKLTSTQGKETGESFKQFPVRKNDCIVGDRAYSTAQGISYLTSKSAYALVRVNTMSLPFVTLEKNKFDLLGAVTNLQREHETREWDVMVNADGQFIRGRLCIIRKNEASIKVAIKKLKRNANKKQIELEPETEEFAKFVILYTTLPKEKYSLESVLEWYRLRWQIELVFKRLKSLAGLGHLPKHDEVSARAWLYGKLFTGLLVEKLIAFGKTISPWGCSQ
jgi:hypothetical protein